MKVLRVYARENAIWPFTVVGRPPQEDTGFGNFIHKMTGSALKSEIPGLVDLHAVDAAGVHPLLLAIGSERYAPFLELERPGELLTIANRILGTGQLSLAKFLLLVNRSDNPDLRSSDIPAFFKHLLERIDFSRDLHFYTETSIDTLDYSGTGLNSGSKVVLAAVGNAKRKLITREESLKLDPEKYHFVTEGILALNLGKFVTYPSAKNEIATLEKELRALQEKHPGIMIFILCDDPKFMAESFDNFLWICFTRSNPSHDISGIDAFYENKHWGCKGALIIDARIKPHHAPVLEMDPETKKSTERIWSVTGFFSEKKH